MSETYIELALDLPPESYSRFNEKSGSPQTSPAFALAGSGVFEIDALGLRWMEGPALVPEREDVLAQWNAAATGAIATRGSMDDFIPSPPRPREDLYFRRRFTGRGHLVLTSRRLVGLLEDHATVETSNELEGTLAFTVPLVEVSRLELFRRRGTGLLSGESGHGLLISTSRPGRLLLESLYSWSPERNEYEAGGTPLEMFEAISRAAAAAQLEEATPEASRLLELAFDGKWDPEPFGLVKRMIWYDNRENLVARLQPHWSEGTTADKLIRLSVSTGHIGADKNASPPMEFRRRVRS